MTGTTGDRTAPQISAVAATPGASSAVITWSTNEASSSFTDYGTSTSYGSSGGLADSVTTHTVTITGLTPATTYHYRVRSKDGAGNEATSADAQVTTLSAGSLNLPVITDVLINGESVFSREAPGTNTVSLKAGDTMTLKGTATPSATVSIFVLSEEEMLYTATADAAGSWSQDIPTTDLAQGEHTIEVATLSSTGEATPRVLLLSFQVVSALAEGPGQTGQRSVLYIILAALVVFIGAVVFLYRRYFGGGGT
ncbi:MAG TPA: fibronectin type III domain-containing protein, partial [Anaerolineales bacterium]